MTSTYQLSLSLEQILTLVRQLPDGEKLKLKQELEKETHEATSTEILREQVITQLLESFQTSEVSLETINAEVEAVRAELYDRQQTH